MWYLIVSIPDLCNLTYSKYYGHDLMGEKERKELLAWLSERKDDVFNFRKEMLQYCRSDVDIL